MIGTIWETVGKTLSDEGYPVYQFPDGKAEHQVILFDITSRGEQEHKDYLTGYVDFTIHVIGKDKKKVLADSKAISERFLGTWSNGIEGYGDGTTSGLSVQNIEGNWAYASEVVLKLKM